MKLEWTIKTWEDLTASELYDLMALRCAVFVVEQNCPYQDPDGKDQKSYHVWARDESGVMVAYARLVKPGVSYAEWSIGRVVTAGAVRMLGAGKELMTVSLDYLKNELGANAVRISAQQYLTKFYTSFGFVQVSEPYLEDDIPHVEMLLTWK